MSRFSSESCWILHRRPWRESSLLIELFSREHGRVGLVARGARGARSAWRGLGEPFQPLTASWVRRGELGSLSELESAGARRVLSGRSLWSALYANELLLKLLGREEPVPQAFFAYEHLLSELEQPDALAPALRRFEMSLLAALGVAPDLDFEALGGEPISANGRYRLDPEAGFHPVAAPGRQVYSGRAILCLAGDQAGDSALQREMRDITRVLIDHQLGGRSLKTRELFRSTR